MLLNRTMTWLTPIRPTAEKWIVACVLMVFFWLTITAIDYLSVQIQLRMYPELGQLLPPELPFNREITSLFENQQKKLQRSNKYLLPMKLVLSAVVGYLAVCLIIFLCEKTDSPGDNTPIQPQP